MSLFESSPSPCLLFTTTALFFFSSHPVFPGFIHLLSRSWNILCKNASAERQVGAFPHRLCKRTRSRPIGGRPLGLSLDKLCALVPSRRFVLWSRDELTLDCICAAAVGARAFFSTHNIASWMCLTELVAGGRDGICLWADCKKKKRNKKTTPLKKQHGQHEFAVLHRGYGSWRLPAEKFLHLVPIFVTERGELSRQARQ